MAQLTIGRIRDYMRSGRCVVTNHAREGLRDDSLKTPDIESIVFSGRIVERQRDRCTREHRYVVRGRTRAGDSAEVVVKFDWGASKLYIITAYLD